MVWCTHMRSRRVISVMNKAGRYLSLAFALLALATFAACSAPADKKTPLPGDPNYEEPITDKPLDPTRFMPWLQDLVAREGQKILRSKGILSFQGDDDRYVFQGVHMMLEGDHQRKWKDDEPRESRVVFIGRELPEEAIREGFARCIA